MLEKVINGMVLAYHDLETMRLSFIKIHLNKKTLLKIVNLIDQSSNRHSVVMDYEVTYHINNSSSTSSNN